MSNLIPNVRYRPEIDGLRALAVLMVVFFHGHLGFPGGYIGVDIFFVISGFLITSLIINDLEVGKFTLTSFWERRVRRIMPAMFVMIFTTLVVGWFLLLPADYARLGRAAAWQGVFGANFNFWINTGYFEGHAAEQPLLHTWSLAVEEQFYMVVPLLFLGLFRVQELRSRNKMLLVFSVGIAVSLAISIYAAQRYPVAAFYLLPSRAWELLCGAVVALIPVAGLPRSRLLREACSTIGLVGILLPCWFYNKTTPFPGLAAIPPVLGTALFILASTNDPRSTCFNLPIVARLLSMRPIVFIGLISYSLYLWHWPLFAFSSYLELAPKSLTYRLSIVLVSFVFAVLSWRYVETPFRKRIICTRAPKMFAVGGGSILATVTIGAVLIYGDGIPLRLPDEAIKYANAKKEMGGIHELTADDIQKGQLIRIGNPDPHAKINLLLWGDSHGMVASPAFDLFLKGKELAGLQATASGTAPVLAGAYWQNDATSRQKAIAFNNAVFRYIRENHIQNVILIGRWEYYDDDKGNIALDTALISTISQLVAVNAHPWVMLQVPSFHFNVPRALAMASILNSDLSSFLAAPVGWNGLRGEGEIIHRRVEAAGGQILDPRPCFIDSARSRLLLEKNGVSLYADDNHLSITGAKIALAPCINDAFYLNSE